MSLQPISFSSSGNVAGSRPVPTATMLQPISASAIAAPRPMLLRRPAPVMMATFPSSSPMSAFLTRPASCIGAGVRTAMGLKCIALGAEGEGLPVPS